MKYEKCQELTPKFSQYYPGGHSNLRVPLEVTQNRVFVNRAEGSHLWDIDGNEYIDYVGAMSPGILGHRNPGYVQALKAFMDETSLAVGSGLLNSTDDIEVAEKLVHHIPCAEKIKFCTTGTEAVQMAIRLARAYTQRPYFIRFGGQYHGWMDNILGGILDPNPTGKPFAIESPAKDYTYTQGKAPGAVEESFLLPWNDIEALEKTLHQYGDEVALIHFEPLVCNHLCLMPRPGFLEKVRDLCTQYGVVMSFDEVIAGFRMGLGGAQTFFSVTPDIATYGKAMAGGGVPVSAVMGKAAIMDLLQDNRVLGPGTFNGFAFGMRAVLASLRILERNDGEVFRNISRVQSRLTDGLMALAKQHGIPLFIQGATGIFYTMFGIERDSVAYTDADVKGLDWKLNRKFWQRMQEEGIIIIAGNRWFVSIAHTDADIDRTLEAVDRVMTTL